MKQEDQLFRNRSVGGPGGLGPTTLLLSAVCIGSLPEYQISFVVACGVRVNLVRCYLQCVCACVHHGAFLAQIRFWLLQYSKELVERIRIDENLVASFTCSIIMLFISYSSFKASFTDMTRYHYFYFES